MKNFDGTQTRDLRAEDYKAELKWYTDKFARRMDGTHEIEACGWCEGIGYGKAFAKDLMKSIKNITTNENGFLRIDWDKTDY